MPTFTARHPQTETAARLASALTGRAIMFDGGEVWPTFTVSLTGRVCSKRPNPQGLPEVDRMAGFLKGILRALVCSMPTDGQLWLELWLMTAAALADRLSAANLLWLEKPNRGWFLGVQVATGGKRTQTPRNEKPKNTAVYWAF